MVEISDWILREVDGFGGRDIFADDVGDLTHYVRAVQGRVDRLAWKEKKQQR